MARRVLASQFVAGLKAELKEKLTGVEGDVDQLIEKARFEEIKRQELRLEKEETRKLRSGDSASTMQDLDLTAPIQHYYQPALA